MAHAKLNQGKTPLLKRENEWKGISARAMRWGQGAGQTYRDPPGRLVKNPSIARDLTLSGLRSHEPQHPQVREYTTLYSNCKRYVANVRCTTSASQLCSLAHHHEFHRLVVRVPRHDIRVLSWQAPQLSRCPGFDNWEGREGCKRKDGGLSSWSVRHYSSKTKRMPFEMLHGAKETWMPLGRAGSASCVKTDCRPTVPTREGITYLLGAGCVRC